MRKKLLLALGGVFFAFLIGEVAARIILPILPDPPNTPFVGDDACMYRLRPSAPGQYPEDHDDHVNEYGFRDHGYPLKKPAGSYRVLGLGFLRVRRGFDPGQLSPRGRAHIGRRYRHPVVGRSRLEHRK
jgi:hypothetical protein